jgi:hypothetical protein
LVESARIATFLNLREHGFDDHGGLQSLAETRKMKFVGKRRQERRVTICRSPPP